MKILVLMKAVAANTGGYTGAERQHTELLPNPADITALEEALKLRDAHGGQVTVLSMGPPSAGSMLKDALARGADKAVLLTDTAFAGADTAATSRTLAAAVQRLGGFELIFCGRKTTDGETGQVGPELAARLNIACICSCCAFSCDNNIARCSYLVDGGVKTVSAGLPALISVVFGINSPRLPSLSGLRRAKREELLCLDRAALGIPEALCGAKGSPTQVLRSYSVPFEKRKCRYIDAGELPQLLPKLRAAQGKERFHG